MGSLAISHSLKGYVICPPALANNSLQLHALGRAYPKSRASLVIAFRVATRATPYLDFSDTLLVKIHHSRSGKDHKPCPIIENPLMAFQMTLPDQSSSERILPKVILVICNKPAA